MTGKYDIVQTNEKMEEATSERYRNKLVRYLSYVTVEPTLVLYMMAFMTTSVVEQSFYVYQACTVNHGYNETVCHNINLEKYKDIKKEVQVTVTDFHIWNNIAGHVVPIILSFFIGAWSDKRGRKLPLLIGLLGKLYFSAMIVVNTTQTTWPVQYVIYTATLPSALTGADVAIFASAITYLCDVTSQKSRTLRVTIMEVFYLATMPLGIALGSFLFNNVVNKSYTIMFTINTVLMVLSVIYTLLRLDWLSSPKHRPISEAPNKLLDFFDYNHAVDTMKTIGKHRPENRRRYLVILIIMMGLYTFQRDERDTMYLYCQLVFNWSFSEYSNFRTYLSALQDVILLLAVPLMSSVLGWRDTAIIMIGAATHTIARVFYSTADAKLLLYIGGAFAAVGPIVAPVIRSMVSKIVSSPERGKALSVLSAADNAIPLISGTAYNALYQATIITYPSAFFFITIATQTGVFLFIVYIHFKTTSDDLECEASENVIPEGAANDSEQQSP